MSSYLPAVSSPAAAHQAPALTIMLEEIVEHLTAPQNEALAMLVEGKTVKDAAAFAGVHRATVHRWITRDPLFRAAYTAWQCEARESAKVKLLSLAQDALAAVTQAISSGHPQLAYRLLKDLGLLTKLKDGLTDPELVRQQIQLEHANQLRALALQPDPAPAPKS